MRPSFYGPTCVENVQWYGMVRSVLFDPGLIRCMVGWVDDFRRYIKMLESNLWRFIFWYGGQWNPSSRSTIDDTSYGNGSNPSGGKNRRLI